MKKIKEWNGLPIVIAGYGGIATEAYHLINSINRYNHFNVFDFKGYISEKTEDIGKSIFGCPIIASDEKFKEFSRCFDILGVVVIHGNPKIKKKILDNLRTIDNLVFPNMIDPTVEINRDYVSLGMGNMITAGVKFTCNITIGNFNLFNLNCTVGHETEIKDYCTINPLTAISGGVKINEGVFIGTGAKILQYRKLGEYSIIGAGAVVIKDVEPYSTEVGVPARCIKRMK